MTPFSFDYHDKLYARTVEIINQNQLQLFCQDLRAMGKTPREIDIEVFFSLIHEGYRMRWLEEKLWEEGGWDYEI